MSTITVDVEPTVYQKALDRAKSEGKTLGQVTAQMLGEWVKSWVSQYSYYTVRAGDTLAQIANRFYGNAKRYVDIAQANDITNPAMIRVGQVLRIPPPSALPPTPKPKALPELEIEFIQSPHYNHRPSGTKIWAIVLHATANSALEGVIRWFTDPRAFVSAHYNIGKDGRIVQMVQDELRAWHAGKSVWKGVHNVNDYSIGIELVNKNDGQDPYPQAQYRALVALCEKLITQYNVQVGDIMGHKDISLSGKTDPAGFDLEGLRQNLAQL